MSENPATFEKLPRSDAPMHGPRGLLLCGFPAQVQPKFAVVLRQAGLSDLHRVWAGKREAERTLAELMQMPNGSGGGEDSGLPRAVIVSGLTANELRGLMGVCRRSGMQQALWATLTPVSETWPLGRLLGELAAERDALQRREK